MAAHHQRARLDPQHGLECVDQSAGIEKNTVPMTAMPIAPPSCCIAFSTPEAEPTS